MLILYNSIQSTIQFEYESVNQKLIYKSTDNLSNYNLTEFEMIIGTV